MKFKNIIAFLLSMIICIFISGCGESNGFILFTELKSKEKVSDGIIAQNNNFELEWNGGKGTVLLRDKKSGKEFSTTPSAVLNNDPDVTGIKNHPKTESPIAVTYFDKVNYIEKQAFSYVNSIKQKNISAIKLENGISVEYSFKTEKISVTVDYILMEDNIEISIDTSKIKEESQNIVTQIAVAPFMCSIGNDDENSYLFVPSGTGAIINNPSKLNAVTVIEEPVYGNDYTLTEKYKFSKTEGIRMPIYGAKNDTSGMFAIIKNGAEAAIVTSLVGDKNLRFSSVYASFLTRGEDVVQPPKDFKGASGQIFSDAINNQVFKVGYYPLLNDDCSYIDMANLYREYLNETYSLYEKSKNIEEKNVHINFVGGTEYNTNIFGIPFKKVYPITDITAVSEITDEVEKMIGSSFSTTLIGYGESGLSIGEIAGGFKLNSALASKKELSKYFNKCMEKSIPTFLDVDTVCFNKSSNGYSTYSDVAVTVNKKMADLTIKRVWSGTASTDAIHYRLLSRNNLEKVNNKVIKYFNKSEFYGISLTSLTSMAYSDYSDISTYAKLGMAKQVSDILTEYNNAGIYVMSSDANDYAVVNSDYVMNVPTNSSGYDAYDVDVPFYQIVFKGYVSLATKPLNLATDFQKALLHCMETGITPSFVIGNNYDLELINSENYSLYSYNKEFTYGKLNEMLEKEILKDMTKLKNTKVVSHLVLNNNVRKTVFENGIAIYVNYGNEDYTDGIIDVNAKGYLLKEE